MADEIDTAIHIHVGKVALHGAGIAQPHGSAINHGRIETRATQQRHRGIAMALDVDRMRRAAWLHGNVNHHSFLRHQSHRERKDGDSYQKPEKEASRGHNQSLRSPLLGFGGGGMAGVGGSGITGAGVACRCRAASCWLGEAGAPAELIWCGWVASSGGRCCSGSATADFGTIGSSTPASLASGPGSAEGVACDCAMNALKS